MHAFYAQETAADDAKKPPGGYTRPKKSSAGSVPVLPVIWTTDPHRAGAWSNNTRKAAPKKSQVGSVVPSTDPVMQASVDLVLALRHNAGGEGSGAAAATTQRKRDTEAVQHAVPTKKFKGSGSGGAATTSAEKEVENALAVLQREAGLTDDTLKVLREATSLRKTLEECCCCCC